MGPRALAGLLAPVPAFFLLRIASALLLLKLSASFLSVAGFAIFAQLLLFASLLNLVAIGGTQNGLIRQSAAAADAAALARTQAAALLIWTACGPALLLAVALAGGPISTVLTGTTDYRWTVAAIAALALAAGPGQVWCSILSGRKQVARSLAAQALGLTAGTLMAVWQIRRGDAGEAAIAFACGPLVTMAFAFRFTMRLNIVWYPLQGAGAAVTNLLRYSGALAATTGFTAIVLFGLRSLYRDEFGATALGYWLAANRISDMSTQLLGLFMIQFFVPHVAGMESEARRRTLIIRCGGAATAIIAIGIATFWLAAVPLVRLFLSDSFVPAIPVIRTYMFGDLMRVSASLAMYAAFARGRPGTYAAIEIGTVSVMAAIAVALIFAGDARAPQLGYFTAYALAAITIAVAFLRRPSMRQVTA